jgi:hypothetical protein
MRAWLSAEEQNRPGAAAAGVDGLRQCGRSHWIERSATAEVRSFCDARGDANRARVWANDREYEVSLWRRCQDVDNFWTIVGIRTISQNLSGACQGPDSGWQG